MEAEAAQRTPQRPDIPTGTVTFLFTDIEGSTQRWDADRAAMQEAVRRHDTLLRHHIAAHHGYVFKTVGDAFCAAFASAADGIGAALEAQRALGAEDWSAVNGLRVRMALHTGTADERDGDYFGPAVNRVARLLAVAHGAQVVVSGVTTDLLQGEMPAQSSLRDLGVHHLKDLSAPEQVYQLVSPGLREDFPPLRSLGALPNNLPRQLTTFIGRDEELREIAELIERADIVTLVGTGGVGKTRAALQVAANLLDGSGDGVWFVELAPLADPALVVPTILSTLGVAPPADRTPLEGLVSYLSGKHLLLVLDNCEHLVAEAARVAEAVVRGARRVKVLATSREALNVAGERVYRMPSLAMPPPGEARTAVEARGYPAVALFVERAEAADARFALTDENAAAVAEVCRRLDGIAFAIELAAPRVKVLSVQQLAQRLDERFRILTGGRRTALPRQQTMRALVDWSYDLLDEREKTLFRRLSVFSGGWTLEAASEICADGQTIEEWDVLDLLSSLVDKSLVVTELAREEQRYALLESIRQYACERLADAHDVDTAQRHARYYCAFAATAEERLEASVDTTWAAPFPAEIDNVRAAIHWSVRERHAFEQGVAAIAGMRPIWGRMGLLDEAIGLSLEALTAGEKCSPLVEANVRQALGGIYGELQRTSSALEQHHLALDLFRRTDDKKGTARALSALSNRYSALGEHERAKAYAEEALPLAREAGGANLVATALISRATSFPPAEIAQARTFFEQAASTKSTLRTLSRSLWAESEAKAGEYRRAIAITEAITTDPRGPFRAIAFVNLAAYHLVLDEFDAATRYARDALITGATFNQSAAWVATQYLASVAQQRGDAARAARLLGFANARLRSSGIERQHTEQVPYDRLMERLNAELAPDRLERLLDEGSAWTDEEGIAQATSIAEGT